MEKLCLAVTITIALYLLLNLPSNPDRKASLSSVWLHVNTSGLSARLAS